MKRKKPIKSPLPGMEPDAMFPVLTAAQRARVAAHGRQRHVEAGETVVEPNTRVNKFFVVNTGQLDVLRPSEEKEEIVAVCRPGTFTGELNVLSGRPGLVRIRAAEACELIEIDREQLMALLQ